MPRVIAGSAGNSIDVFVQDSSSTSGAGLTGLVYNTAGLKCVKRRGPTAAETEVTLANLAAVTDAHSPLGFKQTSSTLAPGKYRFDIPDADVEDDGTPWVTYYFFGASNMAPSVIHVDIDQVVTTDFFDTDARSEPTSVPAANASMAAKIDFLYLLARNKMSEDTSDAKQYYYQDDGTTVFAEASVSTTGDATTRGELADPA